MKILKDIVQTISVIKRTYGGKSITSLLLSFLYDQQVGYVFKKNIHEPVNLEPPAINLPMRFATVDDLPLFSSIVPPLRIKRFAKKIQAGELCHICLKDDRVICFDWVAFDGQPTTKEFPRQLRDREAYCWGAFTLPEYRSMGVLFALNLEKYKWLIEHGYEETYYIIGQNNKPSLRFAEKINAKKVGEVRVLRLCFLKWTRSKWYDRPGVTN